MLNVRRLRALSSFLRRVRRDGYVYECIRMCINTRGTYKSRHINRKTGFVCLESTHTFKNGLCTSCNFLAIRNVYFLMYVSLLSSAIKDACIYLLSSLLNSFSSLSGVRVHAHDTKALIVRLPFQRLYPLPADRIAYLARMQIQ